MSLQNEIVDLLLKLKDKNLSKEEKNIIKAKLKKLYSKIKKITPKRIKIKNPYSEEVKDVLNPIKQTIISEKQKMKLFENSIKNEIKVLEEQRAMAVNPEELSQLSLLIKEKKEEIQQLKSAVKEGQSPSQVIENVIEARNVMTKEDLKLYVSNMIKRKIRANPNITEEVLKTETKQAVSATQKRVEKLLNVGKKFNEAKNKEELEKLVVGQMENVVLELQAEREQFEREKEARELRRAQEAEIRAREEALKELQRQEQEAQKRQREEDERNRMERKEAGAIQPKKPAIREGFFSTEESHPEHSIKPRIIADFIDMQRKASKGTIPERDLTNFKAEMALAIAEMTPAEQWEIRKYTVSRAEKDLEEILKVSKDIIIQSGTIEDPEGLKEALSRLETRDAEGKFLDWQKLEGQGKKKSNYNYMGKKKVKGGAGIADWALTLGSIPGIPQLMNNFGPFGQVLGNASGLAQSFGKTAGQLIKEQSKDGEKVAGFTDAITSPLGGLTKMFGFGKKRGRGKKANMADVAGGAFLSDFLGTIGGITPKISGLVGAVPTYGKVATIGNSVLGSASRVGEDIAKMLGLGNMDTTLAGFGNADLTGLTKGYGKKKGGRKMLPHGRPMPTRHGYYTRPIDDMGMANILPYGLQAENPQMLEGMGEEMTPYLKDIFPLGIPKFRGKGKKMKGGYLTNLFNIFGKGEMKGKGKINGQYVSSEFEEAYNDALLSNRLQENMLKMSADKQFEQEIQRQMNIEQQNALTQLQYYDLLNKAQQGMAF
jgi:hypothetical protein